MLLHQRVDIAETCAIDNIAASWFAIVSQAIHSFEICLSNMLRPKSTEHKDQLCELSKEESKG